MGRPTQPPTLIVGDWHSRCGVCGLGAAPEERSHLTVLPGLSGGPEAVGCRAEWTHVAATADTRIGAETRIQEMRPDLTFLQELL